MSADLSRQRFNPLKNLSGVLQQQGRVQLDADWNEFVEILDRRFRAETTDIIGRCVVPRETPDGFKITVIGNNLNIGPGRIYVDGLLAENHGDAPAIFDAVLAEVRGSAPVLYSKQPYLPSAKIADLNKPAPLLVYIDVWEREVTFIEDPDLVEKAVGVDTTARVQTVWQVRALHNVGANATCSSDIQAWNDLIAPSAGRLTTAALGVPSTTDPCLIPPTGGYRGLENQLYRVEIHDVDVTGKATFKWSRDNASVATRITAVDGTGTVLTVDSVGRDSVLCFKVGQWVEITDDVREFDRTPGVMRKVLLVGDKTITLGTALAAADLPNLLQHARVKRWDQSGNLVDTNGGVIPVLLPGTSLPLENGVEVTFSLDPSIANGKFHVGDYWVFAARTADASVEQLNKAAPRGIHHHYGRLAIVTFPGPTSDCRVLWPPEDCCDCSVCVTAESHNNGTFTIQQAIDKIKNVGGTVCLGPGLYQITNANPVRIDGARSIRLKGQSWATILLSFEAPGVSIFNSLGATLEDLTVANVGVSDSSPFALDIGNSVGVTVQRCAILRWNTQGIRGAAIRLGGFVLDTRIRENAIFGADGIAGFEERREVTVERTFKITLTALLRIDDNFIFGVDTGISFAFGFYHLAENRIAGNYFAGCRWAGMEMHGQVAPDGFLGSRLDLHGNALFISGHGIVISTNQTRITDNDISPSATPNPDQPRSMSLNAGILLAPGGADSRVEQCQILGNRINRMGGLGISLATRIGSAMIKQNIIDGTGLGGIVMDLEGQGSAEVLTIENNQISNVAADFNGGGASLFGIGVARAQQATIAGNTISGVGLNANQSAQIGGISISDSISVRIISNTIFDIAPPGEFANLAGGILVNTSSDRIDVSDNEISRNRSGQRHSMGKWYALLIAEWSSILGSFFFRTAANNFIFASGILVQIPPARRTITVHGNLFEAYGAEAVVEVVSDTACLFNDNRCILGTTALQRIARIEGNAIILSANYFEGPRTTSPNFVAVTLNSHNGPFTILGNMLSGKLLVNTLPAVPPPWRDLNVYTL